MEVWTVALTAALVIVTAIYSYLTWVIAKKSGESAVAARVAAQASQTAAEASRRSALIAEATLPLQFKLSVNRHSNGAVWLNLTTKGATVWLHGARIDSGFFLESPSAPVRPIPPAELRRPLINPAIPRTFPVLVEAGTGGASLDWPNAPFRLSDYGCAGFVMVSFSLSQDSEIMARSVSFEFPQDIYETINERSGLYPDRIAKRAVGSDTAAQGAEENSDKSADDGR